MTRPELTGVPGVPESVLGEALLRRLPTEVAPVPWHLQCTAVVWVGRGSAAARAAMPPALRGAGPATAVVGALVRYQDTPAGAYDEVLAMVVSRTGTRPWGTVALMGVSSGASLVGGRLNWALPKTLAAFEAPPGGHPSLTATAGDLVHWRVSATPRAVGPSVPVAARGTVRQQFPDGRVGDSRLTTRGRLRAALVTVEVTSEGPLPTWLRPGRHPGALVESASSTLGGPTFG